MSYDERTVVACVRRVTMRDLRLWVDEGWVRPARGDKGPVFDDLDIARIRLLCDLRKEMSVPTDTIPVVLSLIDNLHRTRRELKCLANAVEGQPEDVRQEVIATFHALRDSSATGTDGG
ncbi:MerR family transcriptional regulator [Sediminimonas sp.]|uniref:MerR family transcriptional regulator n=1 Tax=Sediminimonas sp. TaxID=2823379 RepID=UPI0025F578A9|nr:MerR family transcriptional regulator [Sediminimonas sp.]